MNILHKIAPSSFCVYLFGLESLAAKSEGFLFLSPAQAVSERKGYPGIVPFLSSIQRQEYPVTIYH